MQSLLIAILFALTYALALPSRDLDWKLEVGWNGITSALSTLGVPKTGPLNGSHAAGTVGGVYFCTNVDWKGTCSYVVLPLNACVTIATSWQNQISSLGPDPGADCVAWPNPTCNGTPSWGFDYPGDDTGGISTDNPWNDRIESIACFSA